MKFKNIALALCLIPFAAYGAERVSSSGSARIGVMRANTGTRQSSVPIVEQRGSTVESDVNETTVKQEEVKEGLKEEAQPENCRDAYRACMDEFCLLDETEGGRCACSDNIEKSKKLIQEIQKIQSEADDLYTTGVEVEKLGAKAKLVFGESYLAQQSSLKSGVDFLAWLNSDDEDSDDGSLSDDMDIGDRLRAMAATSCADELAKCGSKSTMEETLYGRLIVADCKAFDNYLSDQKRDAELNKKTAAKAVRTARLEMLDTTNKYNRGECLLMYRSCIADKGGCGVNFENCYDKDLLSRRANACDDVLDQCMVVRKEVLTDWEQEQTKILSDAEEFLRHNKPAACLAKIQNCLEESCSIATNSACLTNVEVAAGICPIIKDCEDMVPGIKDTVEDKLSSLQVKFCENDVDACLKDKCGTDFTKPECVGKKADEITALCPQSMFASCTGVEEYGIIVSSARLHMDYQLLAGCINQFSEKLSAVCGTDMNCISESELLGAQQDDAKGRGLRKSESQYVDLSKWVDLGSKDGQAKKAQVIKNAETAVDNFFADFSKDLTLSACQTVYGNSSTKVKGRLSMVDSVNMSAKMLAYNAVRNRALRALASKMDELKIAEDTNKASKYCAETYKAQQKPEESGNYSYIVSSTYEPALHNCHVCRVQNVCATGGEDKMTSAGKYAGGLASVGMAAGQAVAPGWGMAIGAAAGGLLGGVAGYLTSEGETESCQEIQSCEDINVDASSIPE